MALTDARCRAEKAGPVRRKISDGHGLQLWVQPTGSKLWQLVYFFQGKTKQIALGPYPEVSLAEARDKRDAFMLVSRASNKDGKYQKGLRGFLPAGPVLSVNDDPRSDRVQEGSTRTRSILFLAFAACAASAISSVKGGAKIPILIPENGFIALNPPMTRRRYGALSTRTAHPHYLKGVQAILDMVGIPGKLENPYYFMTKGEAFAACREPDLIKKLGASSVSCGKWKRANEQCGRCLPCLIRRASFHKHAMPDTTKYTAIDLKKVLSNRKYNADLVAVLYAIRRARGRALGPWVVKSGPLPLDPVVRKKHIDVAGRGLNELEEFLKGQGIPA